MKSKFEKISEKLFPKLRYLGEDNKQLVIVFAGIPASGKTYIAKILEDKYKGVRIRSDDIMDFVSEDKLVETIEENEKIKKEYVYNLLGDVPFRNRFIILDESIDRTYKKLLSLLDSKNLNYFIINIEISEEDAIKRVKARESKENWRSWINRFERWTREHEDCLKNIKPDITLEGMNPDLDKLFKKLERK
ncbi:ATP-binding protein [Candidatus Pacearchaeota archaeon]|nr:ATP-binding protein [Candidatus Pacearchaeota archaeon]